MILEFIYGVFATVAQFFVGLMPDWEPPAFILDFGTRVSWLFDQINGLGAWAPFGWMGTVFAATVGVYVVCVLIKVGLKAASHSPVSGGSG
jgi:hypothetical protein